MSYERDWSYRTISLMSQITTISLRANLLRARSKVRPNISEEQYDFMDDRGTWNTILMITSKANRNA